MAAAIVATATTTTTTTTIAPIKTVTKAYDLQSGVASIGLVVSLTTTLVLPLPRLDLPSSANLSRLIELQMLVKNGKSVISLAGKRSMVLFNTR